MTHNTNSSLSSKVWRTFCDGERTVDFVLAYSAENKNAQRQSEHEHKRKKFCTNLEEIEGLQLEYDRTQRIHFVKIHAPREVLRYNAELLRWEMPISMKHYTDDDIAKSENIVLEKIKGLFNKALELDSDAIKARKPQVYHEYSKDKEYL